MSTSVVKVNGVEVTMDATKPTVININLNQQSALAGLLDVTKPAFKGSKFPARVSKVFSGDQKVLGAVQIVIGLICVSIGVIACFVREFTFYYSGAGFWTGFLFILTGAVAIVGERRSGCCWRFLTLLVQLMSLGVAIGGIVVTAPELDHYWFWYRWNPDNLCNTQKNYDNNNYYYNRFGQTTTPTPESYNWRIQECKDVMNRLMIMLFGVKIMVFVFLCLALCISLYSVGCSIRSLFCVGSPQQVQALSRRHNLVHHNYERGRGCWDDRTYTTTQRRIG